MAFANSAQAQPNDCARSTRTCYDGALSGSGDYASCVVNAPKSCLFNGQTVVSGSSVTGYSSTTVPSGQTCQASTRLCTDGNLSGTSPYANCAVNQPASCLINGQTIASGSSITLYFSASDTSCASEVRTCTQGTLSGSASVNSCQFPPGATSTALGFDALSNYHGNCNTGGLYGAACASAYARFCAASGFATGFGPLEVGASSLQVACVGPAMVSPATVGWATLQTYQSTCSAANTQSDVCFSAANRYCSASGFAGALNITESTATGATLSCLTGPGSVKFQPSWDELHVSHHGCSANGDHRLCATAVARYRQSLGAEFSTGFGVQEYQSLSASVVCLMPQASADPVDAMDTLSYFVPDQSNRKVGDMNLSQIVDWANSHTYMLKYNNPTFFEAYSWDANYIYFAADDTDNPNKRFYDLKTASGGYAPWMPRSFPVGAALEHDDNIMGHFNFDAGSQTCVPDTQDQQFPFSIQLRSHIRRYNTQGSLGVVDAMVISYTYFSDPNAPSYSQERFYFVRTLPDGNGQTSGLGWIRWENYGGIGADSMPEGDPSALTPNPAVDFSSLSSESPVLPETKFSCAR